MTRCACRARSRTQIAVLRERLMMALAGENGDVVRFAEYIRANMALDEFMSGLSVSTHGAAHRIRSDVRAAAAARRRRWRRRRRSGHTLICTHMRARTHTHTHTHTHMHTHALHAARAQLAHFLRRSPYNVNLLIAGHDEVDGAGLYYVDYLASLAKVNYAAHGYASFFTLSVLDRFWKVRGCASCVHVWVSCVRVGRWMCVCVFVFVSVCGAVVMLGGGGCGRCGASIVRVMFEDGRWC
jgi:20S proteasome alpha/beta subunit